MGVVVGEGRSGVSGMVVDVLLVVKVEVEDVQKRNWVCGKDLYGKKVDGRFEFYVLVFAR